VRYWNYLGLALGAILAINNTATATIITIEVTGTVDSIETAGFVLDGSVVNGTGMTGFCTYDTDAPDQEPSEERGIYSMLSISMTIGNYTFTHDAATTEPSFFDVSLYDYVYFASSEDPRFDGTIFGGGSPFTYNDITWGWAYMELMNLCTSSGEYIPTDALPSSFPDLSVFDLRRKFEVRFYDESYYKYFNISGEVTSLNVIPEPGTVFMLGLGGLALIRRRKFSAGRS